MVFPRLVAAAIGLALPLALASAASAAPSQDVRAFPQAVPATYEASPAAGLLQLVDYRHYRRHRHYVRHRRYHRR